MGQGRENARVFLRENKDIREASENALRKKGATTFANQYIDGTIVRLDIPPVCGMQQANQFFGPLTVIDSLNFSLPLDTTTFGPFSVPTGLGPHLDTCAQVVPIAENNGILSAAVMNVLPYP